MLKAGVSASQTEDWLVDILTQNHVHIVNPDCYYSFMLHAEEITPDPDDTHYLALALQKACPLWSNDKKLKQQKEVIILTTEELSLLL